MSEIIDYIKERKSIFQEKYIQGNSFKILLEFKYGSAAKEFRIDIINHIEKGIKPKLKSVSLKKHINSRGRYTNKKFWESIKIIKKVGTSKINPKFQTEIIPITKRSEYFRGFLNLYPVNSIKIIKKFRGIEV